MKSKIYIKKRKEKHLQKKNTPLDWHWTKIKKNKTGIVWITGKVLFFKDFCVGNSRIGERLSNYQDTLLENHSLKCQVLYLLFTDFWGTRKRFPKLNKLQALIQMWEYNGIKQTICNSLKSLSEASKSPKYCNIPLADTTVMLFFHSLTLRKVGFQTAGRAFPCPTITKVNLTSNTKHPPVKSLHTTAISYTGSTIHFHDTTLPSIPSTVYICITAVTKLMQESVSLWDTLIAQTSFFTSNHSSHSTPPCNMAIVPQPPYKPVWF